MTFQEKLYVWITLYKCTRNGYPGATYQGYDNPRDPRVRGGRWNWTYRDLRALYDTLIFYTEAGNQHQVWLELQKYKNKIPPACLRNIYNAVDVGIPKPGATYYILAETGDILNTEKDDKLRTE